MQDKNSISDTSLSIAHIDNPKSNFQYFQFLLPTPEKNIIQCEKYNSYELSFQCYQSLAVLHKDVKYCESIKRSFETGSMHKDHCYDLVARELQNVDLCQNIGNKNALSAPYADCVASIKKTVLACPPLEPPHYYNGSYSCYLEAAVAKMDLSVCDKFGSDNESKMTCYESVAETKKDASICELGSSTGEQRDSCYSKLFFSSDNQNESLCEKITNTELKNRCHKVKRRQLIAHNNDIKACNDFASKEDKGACFYEIAEAQNNPALCERIESDELAVNQCVIQSSPAISNPSICETLKDTHYDQSDRYLCYFQYATVNQKPEICEKMNVPDSLYGCLDAVIGGRLPKLASFFSKYEYVPFNKFFISSIKNSSRVSRLYFGATEEKVANSPGVAFTLSGKSFTATATFSMALSPEAIDYKLGSLLQDIKLKLDPYGYISPQGEEGLGNKFETKSSLWYKPAFFEKSDKKKWQFYQITDLYISVIEMEVYYDSMVHVEVFESDPIKIE